MKVTVNNEETPKKREYPYLGEHTSDIGSYFLVLFTSRNTGIVLKTNTITKIGEIYSCGEEKYTLFKGEITLSN